MVFHQCFKQQLFLGPSINNSNENVDTYKALFNLFKRNQSLLTLAINTHKNRKHTVNHSSN